MKKMLRILGISVLGLTLLTSCGNNETSTETTEKTVSTEANETTFEGEIQVVTREDGSGTRGAFVDLFGILVKDDQGNENDMTYEEAIVANKTDVVLTTVQSDDYSIGYVSLGSLNENVKSVKIEGVEATTENATNGSYEISRPFNIATKGEQSELVKDFITYMLSVEGQEIASESFITVEGTNTYIPTGLSGKITVGGSTSVSPLMEKYKEAYEVLNPEVTIEIQALGSSAGMTGVIEGTFDIGMASRELKDSEKSELDYQSIALDAITIVVNNNNPIDDLTKEQVRQIFTGEITKWSDLK